jgi:hypothetical protein
MTGEILHFVQDDIEFVILSAAKNLSLCFTALCSTFG